MDDDGGMGMPNWGYYDQPLKRNIGLQLMPTVGVERDTKPLLSNGAFLHRDCGVPDPSSVPMEFVRDSWIHHRDNNKILHALPMNPNYALLSSEAPGAHTLQMLQPPEHSQDDKSSHHMEEAGGRKETPLKKRSQGRAYKVPKPKKPKKNPASRDETNNPSVSRGKAGKKSMGVVINGIDLDISGIPTPVCSCTGTPQPCYRWGIGGWQSACCTTSMSMYPLPMSPKRRGARIAGRKMSQGAFKKVLERLAGEGYNLGNPIDLRPHWAKHGTNKFVTIR